LTVAVQKLYICAVSARQTIKCDMKRVTNAHINQIFYSLFIDPYNQFVVRLVTQLE